MHPTAKKYGLCFLLLLMLYLAGCEKEYSYEGGAVPPAVTIQPGDSSLPADSIHLDPGELPNCLSCTDPATLPAWSWSFKTGHSLLCGEVDTAIMLSLERNTFTFFGPATCGTDTGLIFTVSLAPNALDRDIQHITASNAVFYYYHTNAPYILTSQAGQSFRLTIIDYNHSTKLVTGTFNGTGFRGDGRGVTVTDGKFKIRLI